MKNKNELINGECKVVTDNGVFDGYYDATFEKVFFTIPSSYEIIGYLQ